MEQTVATRCPPGMRGMRAAWLGLSAHVPLLLVSPHPQRYENPDATKVGRPAIRTLAHCPIDCATLGTLRTADILAQLRQSGNEALYQIVIKRRVILGRH